MENIKTYAPTGTVETITPAMAEEYLRHNEHNPRKRPNRKVIDSYAQDMKTGNWFINGEPIVFDANGDLKNGQHRLMAIIKANVPIEMLVVRGVDPRITTFDYGFVRSMSAEIECAKGAETLANVITTNAYAQWKPSKGVVRDYILRHREMINRALTLSGIGANHSIGKKRDVFTAIYLMLRCGEDENEIEQFMRVVNTQFMLTSRESSSAIVLFKQLSEAKRTVSRRNDVLTGIATVMAAFADFAKGNKRTLRYKTVNTAIAQNMLTQVRREDGLEG